MKCRAVLSLLTASLLMPAMAQGDYPYQGTTGAIDGTLPGVVGKVTFQATVGGASTVTVPDALMGYRDLTGSQVSVVPGDKVTMKVYNQNGEALVGGDKLYLYIDLNQDGQFSPSLSDNGKPASGGELVAYNSYDGKNSKGETVSTGDTPFPDFYISSLLATGVYRARLVGGSESIDPTGETGSPTTTTDFLLNVHNSAHSLTIHSEHGSVHASGMQGHGDQVYCFNSLVLNPTAAADGYVAEEMIIRHGHHIDGPQYIHGNRQWSEYSVPVKRYAMPRDSVNGDVRVIVKFQPTAEAEYKLVFSDEFEASDGSAPDATWWMHCARMSSTWNRWLADTDEEKALTTFISDGKLVARAVPNPFMDTDNVPMVTGGVKTMGKFGFTYGKVECRVKSSPWAGNFPAIWLMPENQSAGWPDCGEIDIWEVIDTQGTSYHTLHTHWTYDMGNKYNPTSSFTAGCPQDRYHTVGFEWDETSMRWYVDGIQVGSYAKSTDSYALENGQWPYDKHFHLILNQSVGNGSWAANADVTHTYETTFDWIRVYQKSGQENTLGVSPTKRDDDFTVNVGQGVIHLSAQHPVPITIVDLLGRIVWAETLDGADDVRMDTGIYIVNGKKIRVL